jgi:anti-anti-sigma factor
VRPERDRVLVALSGELDIATVARAERPVRELYERGFTSIVFDLRALTFIDSTGLKLLLRLDGLATANGCRFAIVAGDGAAHRLLELTRLTERFAHAAPADA